MRARSSKRALACAIPKAVKDRVWERDQGACVWCGNMTAYVFPDAHFIPRSRGGLGVEENVLTLCRSCHRRYDYGDACVRALMRAYFREYLQSRYPAWDERTLFYRRDEQ